MRWTKGRAIPARQWATTGTKSRNTCLLGSVPSTSSKMEIGESSGPAARDYSPRLSALPPVQKNRVSVVLDHEKPEQAGIGGRWFMGLPRNPPSGWLVPSRGKP